MRIGIIPNTTKENIVRVVSTFSSLLEKYEFEYLLCDSFLEIKEKLTPEILAAKYVPLEELFQQSDLVVSIGGDGTMLTTAHIAINYNTPIMGLNIGKLGFLAEYDLDSIEALLLDLRNKEYSIEERIVLEADCIRCENMKMFSINDVVIDKGGWPKMVEITIKVDESYVTTFSADGLILATPTGSTGYSLSTGGPVIDPKSDAIVLCPISPHTLNMRPIVLASSQKIYINVKSQHSAVYINCDGQRVHSTPPPLDIVIYKSDKKVRLLKTKSINYFKILREKLSWGLDVRRGPIL